jgi:pimeloyl-ACP methyl ester carboxylesterase
VYLPVGNPFERFRIGDGAGSYSDDPAQRRVNAGSQFPVEAYDNFPKQLSPRWLTTDDAIIAAYIAEVDRVCPCAILVHSQGGLFGFKVAQARPEKVKALIAVEPAAFPDSSKADVLKDVPVLLVYGDYIERDSRWPKMHRMGLDFAAKITAAGGKVAVIELPKLGIKGNSHMLMMDKNNLEVAALIQKWLGEKGLVR